MFTGLFLDLFNCNVKFLKIVFFQSSLILFAFMYTLNVLFLHQKQTNEF